MTDALFTPLDDGRFLPTELSRGPWSPHALHGGPTTILMAREAERILGETGRAHVPVRLTVDLERPVPLAPLTVETEIVRPGRKVQVAQVVVSDADGNRLAAASALAIRREPIELPGDLVTAGDEVLPPPVGAPSGGATWKFPESSVAYHQDATEHRAVRGSLAEPGPVTDWIRLLVDVLPGEAPTPFQRIAAAADFLNGVSATLSPLDWTFINPDLTITVHRLPAGEWVAIDAVTRIDADGTGTAEADLHDEHGRLGRAVQTLLIEPRPDPTEV